MASVTISVISIAEINNNTLYKNTPGTPVAYIAANASAPSSNYNSLGTVSPSITSWNYDPGNVAIDNYTLSAFVPSSSNAYQYAILYFAAGNTGSTTHYNFTIAPDAIFTTFTGYTGSNGNWAVESGGPVSGNVLLSIFHDAAQASALNVFEMVIRFSPNVSSVSIGPSTSPGANAGVGLQAVALYTSDPAACIGPITRVLCADGERRPIAALYPHADVVAVSPGGSRLSAPASVLRQKLNDFEVGHQSQRVYHFDDGIDVTHHHQLLYRSDTNVRDALLRPAEAWYCTTCGASNTYMSCDKCAPEALSIAGYEPLIARDVHTGVQHAFCERVYHVLFDNRAIRRTHAIVVGDGDVLSETLRSSPLPEQWEL